MHKRLRPWLVPLYSLLPEDPAGPDATSGETGAPAADGDDLGEGGKRALDAVRSEKRAAERRAAAAEAELKKLRDADLSEQQRATQAAEEAKREAAESTARALRLEVALDKGLPKALAVRLVGSTQEELEADADSLKALLGHSGTGTNGDGQGGTPSPSTSTSRVPRPDPSQGSKQTSPPSGRDAGLAEARRRFGNREPAERTSS